MAAIVITEDIGDDEVIRPPRTWSGVIIILDDPDDENARN